MLINSHMRRALFPLVLLVSLCLVSLCLGCGGGFDAATAVKELNSTNAQRLSSLYVQHRQMKRGKGPTDETAFRKFISDVNPLLLERIGVDAKSLDDLFVSERDGEALIIKYGLNGNDFSAPVPVVFEAAGVDGKRLVAFTGSKFEFVEDEQEYQELLGEK